MSVAVDRRRPWARSVTPRRPRRRRAWVLEALEGRACPSTFPVTSPLDTTAQGTLRWAITQADQASDDATITFAVTGTITLNSALPDLAKPTGTLTISGPGASSLTVARSTAAGTPAFRIFTVDAGTTAAIASLTITNGSADYGGGIDNAGALTLTDSTVSGNTASFGGGGGISNSGVLKLTDSIVRGNQAIGHSISDGNGGGIFNSSSGTMSLTGSAVSGNTASFAGGGIFDYYSGTVTLTDSTVSGNTATYSGGGGIYSYHAAKLTLTGSTVSGNTAFGEGGIGINSGSVTLTDSTVSGNKAGSDGGIGIFNGTATLTRSTISRNTATVDVGGGIVVSIVGVMTLTDSTVSGNTASLSGGGIYNEGGNVILTDSTVSGNTAPVGGGIYNEYLGDRSNTVTLTDSTVSGNTANFGGGIYNNYRFGGGGTLTLTDSTVSGNTARQGGGGIDNLGTASLLNSILAKNTAPASKDGSGTFASQGHNLIGDTNGNSGWVATDLLNVDPLLGPLQDNGGPTQTMALFPGSPAIDAGVAVPGITTDQRGVSREANGPPDIGAFEVVRGDINSLVQVALGGFRYDRATGQFVQPVTITNVSNISLQGPLALALEGLTTGVTLVNATGTAPDGSPEIAVPLGPSGVLAPNQVVSLLLRFADPSFTQIAYTPHLLAVPTTATADTSQAALQFGVATFDSATGRYLESVRITNTSASAFAGPLALALDGLPSGVSLFNATGTTAATSPAGSPYLTVLTADALQPGQSVTVVLVFVDPGQVQVSFHARLLEGPGAF